MKFTNDRRTQPVRAQREMPFLLGLEPVKWVEAETVASWKTYREAVCWCWANRPRRGLAEPDDQALFSRNFGVHAPHMSRFVNPDSKAPMELHPDLIPAFENYVGWRGITQYLALISKVTIMEQVIEARRVA